MIAGGPLGRGQGGDYRRRIDRKRRGRRGVKTKTEVLDYAKACWKKADTAVASIGDEQLQRVVNTPWNMSFPGWVGIGVMNDEFIHHRGQLFVFARLCGVAPPFIWGFADNAPEFRPGS